MRARCVVDAGMDDAGVVGGLMLRNVMLLLKYNNPRGTVPLLQLTCCCYSHCALSIDNALWAWYVA